MAARKGKPDKAPAGAGGKTFQVEGRVRLEGLDAVPDDLRLTAYAFDETGKLLGRTPIGAEGEFKLALPLEKEADVRLHVAPDTDPEQVQHATTHGRLLTAAEWTRREGRHLLVTDVFVLRDLWSFWWPHRICVSGHLRKVVKESGATHYYPVPFAKVEVFDVDREGCWWPYLFQLKELLAERVVVRADALLSESHALAEGVERELERARPIATLDPRPPDPRPVPISKAALPGGLDELAFNPQPEPPIQAVRVGEIATLGAQEAKSLEKLVITTRLEPWLLFPGCYYSKEKMCQDFTDCNGYFRCCFWWGPWHWRKGRLRFDLKPDVILRVTQVIDGVTKVIYLDPYSSTRWNSGSTHIDLFLDDEDIISGPGCSPGPALGDSEATVLQIGRDEVWRIDKSSGRYRVPSEPASNGAYGHTLYVRGEFSADLKSGAPKRYYRLSWAKDSGAHVPPPAAAFTAVQTTLEAWRAAPGGVFQSYLLGPQPSGPVAGLYEIQDTAHWWIIKNVGLSTPGGMVLGTWPTASFESDEGTYWLRLEVFDQNGTKMPAINFPNYEGNGTGLPVPPTTSPNHLDLMVHVDNQPMTFSLTTPATNPCGVIKWSPGLTLPFTVHAAQPNGRVHRWELHYNKGVNPTEISLGAQTYTAGTGSVNQGVNGNSLLTGLTTTCAFGLHLYAWAHVRVNYGWHYYGRKSYAIAVEKCE